jgi:hypothetical protein
MKSIFLSIIIILIIPFSVGAQNEISTYKPVDQKLHKTISHMDSVFFEAYNSCNMEKQKEIYADDIEFFHDKSGLSTSKSAILEATENNICGKVTRSLVKGSIEVYPINNYGAVEIGYHKFFNNQEPDAPSNPSKFIIMWHYEKEQWKITKVISLH